MIRIVAGFFILMVMISAGTVYSLKETNESLEQQKEKLSSLILKDQAAIKVLRAEMAYLSRPQRLAQLSNRYLVLRPVRSDQMLSSVAGVATRMEDENGTAREGRILAGSMVDNFPVLLPQEKPDFSKRLARLGKEKNRLNQEEMAREKVYSASFTSDLKPKEDFKSEKEAAGSEKDSFYTRIMAKIRSDE